MGEKKQIKISVKDKIACLVDKEQFLVCGNNDYEVVFDFDSDWEGISAKTAVFVYGNTPVHQPFTDNVCKGVAVENATLCAIGVFAGNIKTTTGATIECKPSIRDLGGVPKAPSKEVYDEIMDLLDKAIEAHTELPVGGKKGQVLKKQSDKDYDTAWENDEQRDLTEIEKKIETLNTSVTQNAKNLANKLDKTTLPYRLYGTKAQGEQDVFLFDSEATPNSIVRRDKNADTLVNDTPIAENGATSKKYVGELINPLAERVSELESLTLTYTEDTATAYEKSIPAEVGKYALIKKIGGATEKVSGKNEFNPNGYVDIIVGVGTMNQESLDYTVDNDGWITVTLPDARKAELPLYTQVDSDYISSEDAGYYALVEYSANHPEGFVNLVYDTVEIYPCYDNDSGEWVGAEYKVRIMLYKHSDAELFKYDKILPAPEGTVYEPYQAYLQDAEVERIDSIGADGETVLDTFEIPEALRKLKAVNETYYDYIECIDDKKFKHEVVEEIVLNGTETWKNNGDITSPNNYYLTIVTSDKTKYVSGQVSSDRYDFFDLGTSNREVGIDAYVSSAFGGFAVGVRPHNVTSYTVTSFREYVKANPITVRIALNTPEVTDITHLFTEDNAIEVQQGGAIRFVNERKMAVPNTIAYVTRKE